MKLHSRKRMKRMGLSTVMLASLASLSGESKNETNLEQIKLQPSSGSVGLSLKTVSIFASPSMMMVVGVSQCLKTSIGVN